jgi:hypothetical protein
VVTGDAPYSQRGLRRQIVAARGDYLLGVEDNQPTGLALLRDVFDHPALFADRFAAAEPGEPERFGLTTRLEGIMTAKLPRSPVERSEGDLARDPRGEGT